MLSPLRTYSVGSAVVSLVLALVCSVLVALSAFAQTTDERVDEEVEPAIDIAPVIVDGEDLFSVMSAPSLIIEDTEFGPAILIDGHYIATVTQADVEYEGLDALTLAKRVGERILEEIEIYRERRSEAGFRASLVAAVSWTLAFLVFSVLLWLGTRYLREHADRQIARHV